MGLTLRLSKVNAVQAGPFTLAAVGRRPRLGNHCLRITGGGGPPLVMRVHPMATYELSDDISIQVRDLPSVGQINLSILAPDHVPIERCTREEVRDAAVERRRDCIGRRAG